MASPFRLKSPFRPTGDQPEAVAALLDGLKRGDDRLVLQGVTGSGKTFTLANLIQRWGRPTLVLSHNKTLAAQLYSELKEFFPDNAVEYFINVGSVGQPRDGDPRAAYALYDPSGRVVSFRRLEYDVEAAQARIRAAGLPERLAERLAIGR